MGTEKTRSVTNPVSHVLKCHTCLVLVQNQNNKILDQEMTGLKLRPCPYHRENRSRTPKIRPPMGYQPYDFSPCPSSGMVRFQSFVSGRSRRRHGQKKSDPSSCPIRPHRQHRTMATTDGNSATPIVPDDIMVMPTLRPVVPVL
jgi:hypothetical protein